MAIIYHVTTKQEWNTAQQQGFYTAPSLETEGFIHCSKAEQVAGVLQRYFAGKKDLVKLTVDSDKLTARLQYDLSPSAGEEFPHVYGPINLDAVTAAEEMPSFRDNGNI
jgi:uncharacterized protein (DUF952 family)